MNITRIGIDISKRVWVSHAIAVSQAREHTVWANKKDTPQGCIERLRRLVPCAVALEACGGAHLAARRIQALGHTVMLIPAQHVKPYRRGGKNDGNDARAIVEAMASSGMPTVGVKSEAQLDVQAMLCERERQKKNRVALANQIRGLLMERGIVLAKSLSQLRAFLCLYVAVDPALDGMAGITSVGRQKRSVELGAGSAAFRALIGELHQELLALDKLLARRDRAVAQLAKHDPRCVRLMSVPGIGPMSAVSLSCAFACVKRFKKARSFAAALGLAQRQNSTGGKQQLGRITKAGNSRLRALLVHGARSRLNAAARAKKAGRVAQDSTAAWALSLTERMHVNKAVVALANKNARIAWAILRNPEARYEPQHQPPRARPNPVGEDGGAH